MNPRSFKDFEILYNELENWRQHETTRINSGEHITLLDLIIKINIEFNNGTGNERTDRDG